MQIVIDIPKDYYNECVKKVENGDCDYNITEWIANGTPIPDNATNGDIFNAIYTDISRTGTVLMDDIENIIVTNVNIGWWNAPYQKGGNSEYLGGELYQGEFENR